MRFQVVLVRKTNRGSHDAAGAGANRASRSQKIPVIIIRAPATLH